MNYEKTMTENQDCAICRAGILQLRKASLDACPALCHVQRETVSF